MTSRITALAFDALDPAALASFWGSFLGWERAVDSDAVALVPNDDTGFVLRFVPTDQPKTGRNQVHFDLTSTSAQDQQQKVARVLELGGRHYDVGQRGDEGHVVLADPEDNEFCVIEPDNSFLADCGLIGALSSDGSQQVGYFWGRALGWPLVWDQDEETAIRAVQGGPIISWGGPPVAAKVGRNRLRFDLEPVGGDQRAEVERLVSLGATRLGPGSNGSVELADPGGNEFCVLPAGQPPGRGRSISEVAGPKPARS